MQNLKDEKLEKDYSDVWSYYSLGVDDRTFVKVFEGL